MYTVEEQDHRTQDITMNSTEYVMAMIAELRNNSGTIAKQEIIAKYYKAGKQEDNGDQLHARHVLN